MFAAVELLSLRTGIELMNIGQLEREHHSFDVAIVGAGPAGLSAGVWLARYLHDVAVIDSGDPRNWQAQEVHGVLGHEKIKPAKLRRQGQKQCRHYGASLLDAHVDHAWQNSPDDFELETDDGRTFHARRLLLAMGIRDRWPDVPGLKRCYGTTVHTCPNCDGYESRDAPAAVIGAGDKAASVALALTTWTRQIAICTHGEQPTFDEPTHQALDRLEIEVYTEPMTRLEERHRHLRAIRFDDTAPLECEHLFIAMGQCARDDIGAQLGCNRNDRGFIIVDDHHHTSVQNVFAAGDITPGAQMAIRAAAGGAEAALSIHHSLIPEYRRVHREC